MPSPHDCLAQGHGTSPRPFPLSTAGVSMMDTSRKPIRGVHGAVDTPRQRAARHKRPLAVPKSTSNPPPAGGRGRFRRPKPGYRSFQRVKPTPNNLSEIRYPRPPASSGVRWATCRWLLSDRSVDRAQPYVESAARGADRARRPDRRFTGNFKKMYIYI
jgi:hypothetical protein